MKISNLIAPAEHPELAPAPTAQAPDDQQSETQLVPAGEGPDVAAMPRADALAIFKPFNPQIAKIDATADTLTVTDVNDKTGMALARMTRLSYREIRLKMTHVVKEVTEGWLRSKQQVDRNWKTVREALEEKEARMFALEQFAETEAARLGEARRVERTATLEALGVDCTYLALAQMPEDAFQILVTGKKAAIEAAKALAAKTTRIEERKALLEPFCTFLKQPIPNDEVLAELTPEAFEIALNEWRGSKEAQEEGARVAEEAKKTLRAERETRLAPLKAYFVRSPGVDLADIAPDVFDRAIADLETKKKQKEDADATAAEDARLAKIRTERQEYIAPFLPEGTTLPDIESYTAEAFEEIVNQCERDHTARQDAEKKRQAALDTAAAELKKTQDANKKLQDQADENRRKARAERDRKAEEARKLAAAGDREKLLHWKDQIRLAAPPTLANTKIGALIADQHRKFQDWIATQATALDAPKLL